LTIVVLTESWLSTHIN